MQVAVSRLPRQLAGGTPKLGHPAHPRCPAGVYARGGMSVVDDKIEVWMVGWESGLGQLACICLQLYSLQGAFCPPTSLPPPCYMFPITPSPASAPLQLSKMVDREKASRRPSQAKTPIALSRTTSGAVTPRTGGSATPWGVAAAAAFSRPGVPRLVLPSVGSSQTTPRLTPPLSARGAPAAAAFKLAPLLSARGVPSSHALTPSAFQVSTPKVQLLDSLHRLIALHLTPAHPIPVPYAGHAAAHTHADGSPAGRRG